MAKYFYFLAVYAAIVLAAVAMLLPETRQVELRQQFKLSQTIKLYGQIIRIVSSSFTHSHCVLHKLASLPISLVQPVYLSVSIS
jgi:hypothetical protein